MADYAIQPVTEDVLTHIDSGVIYLANQRLLFTDTEKNASLRLSKLLDITPYKNGVVLLKESGRSPFLHFTDNIDIFSACLARAMQDIA